MKRKMVVLLGVFIVMLLAMPVLAEPDATSGDRYAVAGGSGVANTDTQSPVLDGSAFTYYDTIFNPGNVATHTYSYYVNYTYIEGGQYTVVLRKGPYSGCDITCPLPGYDKKTGAVQPKVRYLGLLYQTPTTIPIKIDSIEFWNGVNLMKTINYDPPIYSNGWTVRIIDLGDWYIFNRGLTMAVHVQNSDLTHDEYISIGGFGARYEW